MRAPSGRNDPCPCGSRKKFKKCHGQKGPGTPDSRPPWVAYAKKVESHLAQMVTESRNPDVEAWMKQAFWLFSFAIEENLNVVTRDREGARLLFPMMIQMQDLLRGAMGSLRDNTLLPAVSLQRSSMEIGANLFYILQNE